MLYYPDNIRRFVWELTNGKPGGLAGKMDTAPFDFVDPPFPAETAFLAFLEYSRDAGKGVEMLSAVPVSTTGNMQP
jgi:hypothetical protein